MNRWRRFRQWINRDDGRFYQAANRNLNAIETIGWLFFVIAMLAYLLTKKTSMDVAWFGWFSLVTSAVLVVLGTLKSDRNDGNT